LDIREDSEFAAGYGYPKTVFKQKPEMDEDIRNAFHNIPRIQILGKSSTFSTFESIFSVFSAMTSSLYIV